MDLMARKKKLIMGQPHIVTPTPASILAFNTDIKAPLKECKVHFAPVQEGSGDPSPENVRPITGWMGVNVLHCGENLLPPGAHTRVQNGITFTYYENGDIHIEGTASSTAWLNVPSSMYFTITPGTYTLSTDIYDGDKITVYIVVSNANGGDIEWYIPKNTLSVTREINFTDSQTRIQVAVGNGKTVNMTIHPRLEQKNSTTAVNTYPVTFPALGKNLFNIYRTEGTPAQTAVSNETSPREMDTAHYYRGLQSRNWYYKNYVTASIANGIITVLTSNNNDYGVAFPVSVTSGQTYTLSATSTNTCVSFGFYDASWNYLSCSAVSDSLPCSVTPPQNASYMTIVLRCNDASQPATYANVQLESGSTATAYEPFTYAAYGGYVDIPNGKLVKTHYLARAKKSDFGIKNTTSVVGIEYRNTIDMNMFPETDSGVKWNAARTQQKFNLGIIADPYSENLYGNYIGLVVTQNASQSGYMRISEDIYQAMTENDYAEISYKLATPIEYQLTAQQIKTLIGSNNIWSNTNGNIEAAYWSH